MARLKTQLVWALTIATWTEGIVAYRINTTIYNTNLAHVTYSDTPVKCNHWVDNWMFWKACRSWLKLWRSSGVYESEGKKWTYHSSLNHQFASVTIEFQGTDVWVYGPIASEYDRIPPDYKICLYESYHLSSRSQCYQVNTMEAYRASAGVDGPVVVFARGQLQDHEHRIVISVADPVDDLEAYNGIKLSHIVYTNERPAEWPVEEDLWRYREVVMHDTHPLLSYSPQSSRGWFSRYEPWSAKIRTVEDGSVTSWHELKSHNEGDRDQWGVSTKLKAGAVAVYGAPSAYVNQDRLGFVCIRLDLGLCETVDLKTIYANERPQTQHEPVLLWRNDALDSSREVYMSIRLVKLQTETATVFPFKSINYFEEKEYESPGTLVASVKNITVRHDDQAISYSPDKRCTSPPMSGGCESWFEAWVQKEVGPSGSVLVYHSTLWQYRAKEDPHITFSFRGSAVYLYGAPKAYLTKPFASQHICINNACRVVDVEQAYLHPPSVTRDQNAGAGGVAASSSMPHPELEPVLIWSIAGLDGKVEHTLRLALATLPSPADAEMTIVKVVYTRVDYLYGDQPDPPLPELDYTYSGPLYPPHAANWVPLDHKPPPPVLIDSPPGQPFSVFLLPFAFIVAVCCLSPALKFWRRRTGEIQLLSPVHESLLPSSPRPSNGYTDGPNDTNNAGHERPGTPWDRFPSPPPTHFNATDISLDYFTTASNSSTGWS